MTETTTAQPKLELMIKDVRIDRVSLIRPYVGKDAPIDPATGKAVGKYHADLIIAPSHPQLARIKELMRAAAVKKFKSDTEQALIQIAAQDKLALHRGDVTRAGKPQYAGMLYISASNTVQPTIVVTDNGVNLSTEDKSLTPAHPNYPYAGSHVHAIVDFWAYDHPKGGKGISCTLLGVQFLRHDVRLAGSSVASTTEFGLVAGDADGAAPAQTTPTGGTGLI